MIISAILLLSNLSHAATLPSFEGMVSNQSDYSLRRLELWGTCRYVSRLSGKTSSCGSVHSQLKVDSKGKFRTPIMRYPNTAPIWDIKGKPAYYTNIRAYYGNAKNPAFVRKSFSPDEAKNELKRIALFSIRPGAVNLAAPDGSPVEEWLANHAGPYGVIVEIDTFMRGTKKPVAELYISSPLGKYFKEGKNIPVLPSWADTTVLSSSEVPFLGLAIDLHVRVKVVGGGGDFVGDATLPAVLNKAILQNLPTITLHPPRRD